LATSRGQLCGGHAFVVAMPQQLVTLPTREALKQQPRNGHVPGLGGQMQCSATIVGTWPPRIGSEQ
jgi:hypothetical protein